MPVIHTHAIVALVTIAALVLYMVMGITVGRARAKYGVAAPAISGNADFERVFRVQANTLEWLPLFLVAMWLTAIYWSDLVAAGLGLVWIIGRILYMTGYSREAAARSLGFGVQAVAALALLICALVSVVIHIAHGAL